MTYRELRQLLTKIDNQELTIQELREKLFEEQDQDKAINLSNRALQINGKAI